MINKLIKVVLAISLLILSLSVFYKFVLEPFRNERKLERCISLSEQEHTKRWNTSCKALGLEDACGLDKETASIHLTVYEKSKQDCSKRYR